MFRKAIQARSPRIKSDVAALHISHECQPRKAGFSINTKDNELPGQMIAGKIYDIKNRKAMLDADLAEIYRVKKRMLKQAVKRSEGRFPDDIIFQLSGRKLILRKDCAVEGDWEQLHSALKYGMT